MTRAPDLALPSLPRQQRRRVNRELHKLFRQDNCSVCGGPFKHNTRTVGDLDTQGNVILAGECCINRVVKVFTYGFYSTRNYDFLQPRDTEADSTLTLEQIVDAIATYQKAIAETDKLFDGIERRGGGERAREVSLLDHPWKDDDRTWFQQNPRRAHLMRAPFPGELDGKVPNPPASYTPLVLLRQVEPGTRLKAVLYLPPGQLLPLPMNEVEAEAISHAWFEIAVGREPMPREPQAFRALIEKYSTHEESDQ
jgi:hypothetical protein